MHFVSQLAMLKISYKTVAELSLLWCLYVRLQYAVANHEDSKGCEGAKDSTDDP